MTFALFSFTVIMLYVLYKYLFEKPSLKEYSYPYKKPGKMFQIRFLMNLVHETLFRKYLKRFNSYELDSKDAKKVGIVPTDCQEQLESPQSITSPHTMDETGFMGVNLTSGNILHVSLAKRQNNQCEAVIHFVVNDKGQRKEFCLPLLPRTLRRNQQEEGNCWTCNDLKIWCLRPLTRWRISFNGLLRETRTNKIAHVIFNFVWAPFSRVIDHHDDISIESRARALALSESDYSVQHLDWILNQYDTWGTFFGTYTIDDGEESEIILFGSKIRRTGQFYPSDVHKFIQIKGYLEDGTTLSFNAINVPNHFPEIIWGYVELANGTRDLLTSSDFELIRLKNEESPPETFSIRFSASEDKYILDMKSNNGKFSHAWGQNEEMKVICHNLEIVLTSLKHDIRLKGAGMMSITSRNNLELEPLPKLPPLLTVLDVDISHSIPNILQFAEESCKISKLVGGKGSSLAVLRQIKSDDFKIPDGFCITVAVNDDYIKENEIMKKTIHRIAYVCCLGKLFEETDFSQTFKDELHRKLSSQFGEGFEDIKFAVRSSAVGEDGEELSATGQMETILGCKGLQQIFQGIKMCWASCYGFRAVEYRRQNGQKIVVGMAVVVQKMVAAEKAGVLFTRDPVNGNPSVISIAANYGIGEAMVSGLSEPDTIIVHRTFDDQLSIGEIKLGKKELKITMKDGGGIEQKKISNQETNLCCINNEQALKLAQLGLLVEQSYGSPRDIEWAIFEDQIFLLQARPITNLHNETDYFLKNEMNVAMLTDNECAITGNVKEIFPGATSTLYSSYFNVVFNVFALRLASISDRWNLPNTLTLAGCLNVQQHRFTDRGKMLYSQIEKNLFQAKNSNDGLDISMNGRTLEDKKLQEKFLIRNRYSCTDVHYEDLAILLSIDSGSEAVESADVPSALQALSKEIISKCNSNKFIEMSKEEGKEFLTSNQSPVKESYEDFISKHGHRCIKEFDVYSKTWAMDPSKLIIPLQVLVRTENMTKDNKLTVDEALDSLQTELTDKQKRVLRKQVLTARAYVGYREQAKSLLIRIIDQYRKQFWEFSRKLVAEGRLPDEELIFFMTCEEIVTLVKTRSAKIIQRAIRRQRLFPQLDKLKFPDICYGIPKPESDSISIARSFAGNTVLKGIPVKTGIVEGIARVVPQIEDAHNIQPGDILVTNATDIAWSPYFPSLLGIITEIGGLISHGAVVAREYGIPCIVGVLGATTFLKSGDKIQMNAKDGTVHVLFSNRTIFRIKFFFFWTHEMLFRKYYKRFNGLNLYSKNVRETGALPTESQEQLESVQNISSLDTTDETGFMGVNLTSGNVLHVSIAKRQDNHCEAVIHFVVNDKGQRKEFQLPLMPRTLRRSRQDEGNCWTCNDLKIWCLCPLTRWRISFNGLLRWAPYSRVIDHLDDVSVVSTARAMALSESSDPRKDLEWILNQYDTWGTFFGTYTIDDGEETELLLFGSKIRRLGEFHSSDIHKFIQIKGYIEDGSTFSFNAINVPKSVPEMVWGYVELANGIRHILTSSDFEVIRLKNEDTPPEILSIRFNTDSDKYTLVMKSDNGKFSHVWGQNEQMKINCNNLKVGLTSLKHGMQLKGAGMMSISSKNDMELGPSQALPPLLIEPDIGVTAFTPSILEFSEKSCKSSKLVGGKGSSLAMLRQIKSDFKVPEGFCITVAANHRHIEEKENLKKAIKRISDVCCGKIESKTEEECKSLGKLFEETELSQKFKEELHQNLSSLFGEKFEETRFAVRSSAVGEDGEEMSAAGQMETILGCKGLDQICEGIKKCWASCYGFRAVEYRRQNGQQIEVGMAVVVQQMVAAEKAGVLFTRDPVNGNPSVISIAANYGIGESVVSALSDPDTIVIKRTYDDQLSIGEISIGKKDLQVSMKDDGGVEQRKVSEQESHLCCISNDQALRLAELGLLIEQSYGNPRDIEWAIVGGQMYLLQARPITNLHNETEYVLRNELNLAMLTDQECSNSGNFKEVFPGATSTLNNSYFNALFGLLSCRMAPTFGNRAPPNTMTMKGSIIVQQHRFSDRGAMFYSNIEKYPAQRTTNYKRGLDIAFNGRVIEDKELQKNCLRRNKYSAKYSSLKQTLYSIMALTEHIKITISSMTMNTTILVSLLGAETDEHYGDFALLMSTDSGSDAVESADVPSALQALGKVIIAKYDSEKFLKLSKENSVLLSSNVNYSGIFQEGVKFLTSETCPVKEEYEDFMSKHGHRCVKEFDVHSKTWSMDPSKLIVPLQALIRAQNMTKNKKLTVDEALEKLQTKLTSKQKKSLRTEVLRAREYVGYREQAKSLLIRTVHQYRKQFWKFGRKLVSEGRLPDEELIFFMTWEEIIEDAPIVTDNVDGKIVLKGTPVSRGIIEGTARVIPQVEDAHNLEPGDILITNATDIAWSPYFPSLSGVITEIGGLISHGAVVAREYGIACVVGVTNATIHLKSGEQKEKDEREKGSYCDGSGKLFHYRTCKYNSHCQLQTNDHINMFRGGESGCQDDTKVFERGTVLEKSVLLYFSIELVDQLQSEMIGAILGVGV
ncbi:putative phosphoenolpyruvate synthase [Nymphon striatum]|nr:putative phosphoenolpyruvate synthase [Nymphon striatum]KAG1714564.1 putative phosphoenolpyruvate synthase [Nymphon striatum]KAG1714565.1 putative phosphoenolpyruvate synthase [Nymphon striatum]KAG1714566.1 putative phosphoenolpyruvate synthase [Nymphon striatum]KAG1714567.1 putative phosphoenolpyruvate synthase [Nymphon striatum]